MAEIYVDPGQDRIINELFAWVAVDPTTQLESICGFMIDGQPFQAVTSSRATALKIKPLVVNTVGFSGKIFKLVRFDNLQVLETVRKD